MKNHLRPSISQERLISLVILCNEKDINEHIVLDTIISVLHLKMLVKIILYNI
jgi:hypothetical protein